MSMEKGSRMLWSKGIKKRVISLILVLMMILTNILSTLATTVKAETIPLKEKFSEYEGKAITGRFVEQEEQKRYSSYKSELVDTKTSITESFLISNDSLRDQDKNPLSLVNYQDKKAFLWGQDLEYIEFDVDMKESGYFLVEFDYYLTPKNSGNGKRTVTINGEYPFVEANDLVFYRYYEDKGEPVVNTLGNETRPSQVTIDGWRTQQLMDTSGRNLEPFRFYLEKGKNTIGFSFTQAEMYVSEIRFVKEEVIPTYNELKAEYDNNGYKYASKGIKDFQAETSTLEKNDPTLRRETDGDPLVIPHSATERLLNIMGGYRYRTGNQKITWEFEVEEDGLYKLGIRALQMWQDGIPSYRQIEIDGKVPFQELLDYKFDFDPKWNTNTLSDENKQPYEFYLTKGKHTISMTVKFGDLTEIIDAIDDDITIISDLLLKITLIAGTEPDPNYDYDFFNKIPNMKSQLEYLSSSMQEKYDLLASMSDKLPAMANNFLTIKTQLDALVANPYSIAKKIGDLQSSQESLSNWYLELQRAPLSIDYFKVGALDEKWDNKQSNVFQKLFATIKNFFASFSKDYDNVGGVLDGSVDVKETITVWIARGTEWAEVIKEMADEDFTPKTGIAINVNVVPAGQLGAGSANALMLSVISGKAPDVALGVDVTSPVEFAIRDAVVDLSKLEGFSEVKNRFVEATLTPYEYEGGIYAIPETMDFNVMFYRKDILNQFAISLPDTREQLYSYVLPALYQNGLQYYYGRDFTQLLFQNGGSFYTEDGMKTALDSPQAYLAFKEYTELFTNYGVPEVANFYQYMRNGVMPIGIGNFALYMQLSVAAPELAGKWGIAPLPGIKQEDGSIDRTAGAITAQGDVIMEQSKKQDESWEFLKWWSSAEIQTRFSSEVEALMGAEARWNTANKEAFLSLSWNKEDIEVIEEQWLHAKETPIVLGGYFTARHLTNAWTTVVVSGGDVRDALEQAVKEINRELRMKQEEYGVLQKD